MSRIEDVETEIPLRSRRATLDEVLTRLQTSKNRVECGILTKNVQTSEVVQSCYYYYLQLHNYEYALCTELTCVVFFSLFE